MPKPKTFRDADYQIEAEKLLKKVCESLRAGGCVATDSLTECVFENFDDPLPIPGSFLLSVASNCGKGGERGFLEHPKIINRLKVLNTWYTEGEYIWGDDFYVKPTIWARVCIDS